MSVDRLEAARVAELARLALDERELEALAADVSRILDHVRALRSVAPAVGEGPDEPGVVGVARGALGESVGDRDAPAKAPDAAPDAPDPLVHPLRSFAPDLREGFFVVPPPPGVQAGEDDA